MKKQIKIQEMPLSIRIKRKELANLLVHSSVARASTRGEGLMEMKELANLLLHSSVARASTRVEGVVERKELSSLLLHS